jgi:hypothetical protein
MKNLLVCHSRCGSTSIYHSLSCSSPKNVKWGVDKEKKKGWDYLQLIEYDYHMARCNVSNNSLGDLSVLCGNYNCSYMYRESVYETALSLSIGDQKKIWQTLDLYDSYYTDKIEIVRGRFIELLDQAAHHKKIVLDLHSSYGGEIFIYEEVYSNPRNMLEKMNDIHNLDLDIDSAEKHVLSTKKLNDYSNVSNVDSTKEWYKEWLIEKDAR